MSDTLLRLTNATVKLEWNGNDYEIKKANLQKVSIYQERLREYVRDQVPSADAKLVAFALYLVLKESIPDLTEEMVLDNTPGGVDAMDILITLGFVKPVKVETPTTPTEKPISDNSSSPSQTDSVGDQVTSPI